MAKRNVLGVLVDVTDYVRATEAITSAAAERRAFAVTALAVHGVMTAVRDGALRTRLNTFDLVAPDGQPVRWALNCLHRAGLRDRVYGPDLTRCVLADCQEKNLAVFFYGSTSDTLEKLRRELNCDYPRLKIAGMAPSRFRSSSPGDAEEIEAEIRSRGADVVFVGLGCPRQEQFVSAMRWRLPCPLVAVGAAFDYLAKNLPQPPQLMQRAGLEWLWRLVQEPRRLWRRYVLLNPAYVALVALQCTRSWTPVVLVDDRPPLSFPI